MPTGTPTVAATPTPTATLTPRPPGPGVTPTCKIEGYVFEFIRTVSGNVTMTGRATTCGGKRGPWTGEIALNARAEDVPVDTTGTFGFTVPEGENHVELRIPTAGTASAPDGSGTISDPLLFDFTLLADEESAEITVLSTGDGTLVIRLPEAPDVEIASGTVRTTDPTIEVSLLSCAGCE